MNEIIAMNQTAGGPDGSGRNKRINSLPVPLDQFHYVRIVLVGQVTILNHEHIFRVFRGAMREIITSRDHDVVSDKALVVHEVVLSTGGIRSGSFSAEAGGDLVKGPDLPPHRGAVPLIENAFHLRAVVDPAVLRDAPVVQCISQGTENSSRGYQHRADLQTTACPADSTRDFMIDGGPIAWRKRCADNRTSDVYRPPVPGSGHVNVASRPKLSEIPFVEGTQ